MTNTAIFQRPDWSDPTQYEHLAKIAPGWELAWEFLRRNPDYQADWGKYMAECAAWENTHLCEEYTGLALPPNRFFAWCEHFKSRWQLEVPTSPADDFYSPDPIATGLGLSPYRISVPFVVDEFDNIDEYQRADSYIDLLGAKVLIPVNLEQGMETIMEKVKTIVERLREQGIKIGSCSGYPKQVMDKVVALATTNGYVADHVVATDEVPNGRPHPAQALANVIALGISDVAACVKVDDTTPGILEGRSAGMWTVGLSLSGNEVGLSLDELAQTDPAEVQARVERASERLRQSGAHYVIETVADFPAVVLAIQARLAQGETP